jgi:hypothetical protein
MTKTSIAPADFNIYRSEIRGCFCSGHCRPMMYAASLNSGAGNGSAQHVALGVRLLEVLKAGAHVRVTESEYRASIVAPVDRLAPVHRTLFGRLT